MVGSIGGWKLPGQSWKMVRGSGPAGKVLTQPLAGWREGQGDENRRAPHFFSLPLYFCVVRTPDKLLPRKCAWRRSEGVREPHKDRRCKYSILRGCWPPPGALGTVVICAALRPSQIPTLPEGFS